MKLLIEVLENYTAIPKAVITGVHGNDCTNCEYNVYFKKM